MLALEERTGGRVPELDGVRGLAILGVVLWHYVVFPLQGVFGSPMPFALRVLGLAVSGVDLFFVLSGFLIGGLLLDHRESANYFRAFYSRRFCRILPLYFVWLGLFYLLVKVGPTLVASPVLGRLFQQPFPFWSYFTFTQNLLMARVETFGPEWLGITWSLAVEEQFYLLLPLMVRFISPRRLPFAFGVLVLAAPVHRAIADFRGGFGALVLMPCRADALLLGVLCAYLLRRDGGRRLVARSRWALYGIVLSASLTCLAALGYQQSVGFPSLLAVLYAALLLIAVTERRGPVTWLVRQRWLRGLGLLAYGFYLIHQAVNGFAHGLILGRPPGFGTMLEIVVTLGAFAATLALATLSWRQLEQPFIQWGHAVRYASGSDRKDLAGVPAAG
ncbi:MAG TPA: acyltransferase [Thermoanaerobaculia bacterium]|nr:acyltransferase [Thermoanaerobaculia bacterium]